MLVGRYGSRFRIPPEIASLIRRIPQERRYGAVRVVLYLQSLPITNDHPEDLSRLRLGRISWKTHRPGPYQRLNLSKFRAARFNLMRSSFPVREERDGFYQCTAIPEVIGFRVLRIYDYHHSKTAMDYFRKLGRHFPA